MIDGAACPDARVSLPLQMSLVALALGHANVMCRSEKSTRKVVCHLFTWGERPLMDGNDKYEPELSRA